MRLCGAQNWVIWDARVNQTARAFKDGSGKHPPPVIHTRLQIRLNPRFRVRTRARTQSAPAEFCSARVRGCKRRRLLRAASEASRLYAGPTFERMRVFKRAEAADAPGRRGRAHRALRNDRVAQKQGESSPLGEQLRRDAGVEATNDTKKAFPAWRRLSGQPRGESSQ